MALANQNLVIYPNVGSATDNPKMVWTASNATTDTTIVVRAYPTNNGALSFEGSAGQLFGITNNLTGTIFSVNDISGIPSIEVLDNGQVKLAQYNGSVSISTATSTTNYSLTVYGGANITGNTLVTGTLTATTYVATLSPITGLSNIGPFTYGALGFSDTNNLAVLQTSTSSYAQIVLQNTSAASTASTDLVLSNNLGTTSTFYNNIGINSSGFTGSGSFNKPNASYNIAAGGDLVFGTLNNNSIRFVLNNGAVDAMTINTVTNTVNILLGTGTGATGTGALQVSGGVGIGGGLFAGGVITATNLFVGPWAVSTSSAVGVTSPFAGIFTITNVTTATSSLTGALVVAGGVGIGADLYVGTYINAWGNITAYFSSDQRLKENVQLLPNALENVKKLRGVSFDWTEDYINNHGGEDGYFIRKHDVGIIAQELRTVLPEVVAERGDGYLGVKYDRIVA